MIRKILKWTTVLFMLVFIVFAAALVRSGIFTKVEDYQLGQCKRINASGSAEDLVRTPDGVVWLSMWDRLNRASDGSVIPMVKSYNGWEITDHGWQAMKGFKPHGLSVFGQGNSIRLFAINHNPDGESVEIFETLGKTITHVDTISDPMIYRGNALAATGPRSFYLVNDISGQNILQRILERLFGGAYSSVIYYDGEQAHVMTDMLSTPSGLSLSPDGKRLYVAATGTQELVIYDRATDNSLTEVKRMKLGGYTDNIRFDAQDNPIITSHPSGGHFMWHVIRGGNAASPTIVERVHKDTFEVETLYSNRGQDWSVGSVALPVGNEMLLGSVTEKGVLVCESGAEKAQY